MGVEQQLEEMSEAVRVLECKCGNSLSVKNRYDHELGAILAKMAREKGWRVINEVKCPKCVK